MEAHRISRFVKMVLPRSARTRIRRYRQRQRPGLPPTLDAGVIDHVAEQLSTSRVHSTHYQRLTTWKDTGTFRVTLRFDDGHERRVIYKRAVYSLDEIPANRGLPVRQGPPERIVAQTKEGPLAPFVPRTHWVDVDQASDHFDYVWEDLSLDHEHFLDYQEANSRVDLADSLVAMHRALRTQFDGVDVAEFLKYDQDYSEKLWEYTISSLSRNFERTGDPVIRSFLARKDQVREVFLDPAFHVDRPTQPIHGDFNGTNIWVRDEGGTLRMKAVDWEWAGYGLPHADMISVLKWCSEDEKREFLGGYCSAAGLGSVANERRWLRRANMERAILDAGFLSKQYMDPRRSQEWFRDFIVGSLEHLLDETDVFASGRAGL